ncbi:hypothetical protein ACFE04_006235 [Oxalis oulophora]
MSVNRWNSLIREAITQNNPLKAISLFRQMKLNGLQPNNFTFPFLSKACAKLFHPSLSLIIHTHIVKSASYSSNLHVQTALLDMYVKCDQLSLAYKVFEKMPIRDVASWNVIIAGFSQMGFSQKVFRLFGDMRFDSIRPDSVTVMGLVQFSKSLNLVKAIHSFGIRIGVDFDVSVANTFISGYAKNGDLDSAEAVFGGIVIDFRTLVSWNSIISGHSNFDRYFDGCRLYRKMLLDDFKPDSSTLVSLLSSCVKPDAGYAEKGNMDEAMLIFHSMEENGQKPDLVTVISVISGCGQIGVLELGKQMYRYATFNGLKDNVMVCNALMDMYAKCGSIFDAERLFYNIPEKTVISWTSMIHGYALNGKSENALDLFNEMMKLGLKPNHITFLAVLQACAHAGLLDQGWEFFNMMSEEYNITPGIDHYSCIADLLGRKGKLKEAFELILNMPMKPDAGIWGTLLAACKVHRDAKIGEYAAHRLFELEPHVSAPYVEMANLYASVGKWDDVKKIRTMMNCCRVRKFPGQSIVQVNGKSHIFTVEDRNHLQAVELYAALDLLYLQSKEEEDSHFFFE